MAIDLMFTCISEVTAVIEGVAALSAAGALECRRSGQVMDRMGINKHGIYSCTVGWGNLSVRI